jgi:segregation and condensation protein B
MTGLPENENDLRLVIEAILFAATEPVSLEQLEAFCGSHFSLDNLRQAVSSVGEKFEKMQTSLQIVQIGTGYKMTTRPQYAPHIDRFFTSRRRISLSKASLEVLSVVAYKQPVTISDIEHVRGVDSKGIARNLLKRGLITIKGRKKSPGRPFLLATTDKFLNHFGLEGLDSLPKPEEISDIEQQVE